MTSAQEFSEMPEKNQDAISEVSDDGDEQRSLLKRLKNLSLRTTSSSFSSSVILNTLVKEKKPQCI